MPDAADHPAAEPIRYARRLTALLADRCAGALEAAYLHGSAALGGWVPERSDVDILYVVADDIAGPAMRAAAGLLAAPGSDGPGGGLECSVVTVSQARRPAAPWPFVLHVSPAAGGPRVVRGDAMPGDHDLLMHYAVCRAAGITLAGPPAWDRIGPVARPVILGYLAGELGWGLAHAAECYAVLNACRALVYLADDAIVSKVDGGLAALDRSLAPPGLVRDALDQQQGRAPERPPRTEAVSFVTGAAAELRAAAGLSGEAEGPSAAPPA
jgi:Domain of unknown function (DUF4111)